MKGQTEMVGLLIIVVLIVFIGLFAVVLMSKNTNEDDVTARRSVVADNLMNAITKVRIDDKSIEQSVAECCDGNCETIGKIDRVISEIVEEDYKVMIFQNENECRSSGNCDFGISSSEYPLRYYGNRYKISIILCKSLNE